MRLIHLAGVGALVFALRPSAGQSCPGGVPTSSTQATANARQQAEDVYAFMAPQLGLAIVGGNATLGQGGTMGGLGHFSVGLRGNVFRGTLPQVDQFPQCYTARIQSTLPTSDQFLGLPAVDASVGLFKGIPLGLTNVGGVDLLVSASYIPEYSTDQVDITVPDGSLKLGVGARLGLLQESLILPGVSFTYLRRDLPTVSVRGHAGNSELRIDDLRVNTSAWRLVASKSLVLFGLAAGIGQDKYDQSADISATVSGIGGLGTVSSTISPSQSLTRTNMFADVSVNILLLKLVGEIGRVSGGTVTTFNQFEDAKADDARLYGSLGLRLSF